MLHIKKKSTTKRVEKAKDLFNELKRNGVTFEIFESDIITSWSTSDKYSVGGYQRQHITPPVKTFKIGDKWPIAYTIYEMEKILHHIQGYEKWLAERNEDNEFLEFVKSQI